MRKDGDANARVPRRSVRTTESVAGKLEGIVFTNGEYDVVVIGAVPGQTAALAMAVRASGSMSELSVREELDVKAIAALAGKIQKASVPAG